MISEITQDYMKPQKSRLFCPMEGTMTKMFFSLVDYRNNYFTSNDPNKIIEFYNGFENRDQLIQWMKERPKGVANIHEIDGDKNIIVVIPTADFNGKYAKECRENIFKGLHMVFVESGGIGDFYFNIAHNVNVGIRKAMEYNPKWIVFSGDDMYGIDPISVLIQELNKIDPKDYSSAFTDPPGIYHSTYGRLKKRKNIGSYLLSLISKEHNLIEPILDKFAVKYIPAGKERFYSRLFYKKALEVRMIQSFGIFSGYWIGKNGPMIYDEVFINNAEDSEVSILLSLDGSKTAQVHYKIGEFIGKTLGKGIIRALRGCASLVYFNEKLTCIISRNSNNLDFIVEKRR